MKVLTLVRLLAGDDGTFGTLLADDNAPVVRMIELPWRDNRAGISCIPAGEYDVRHLPRSASDRYRDVYEVSNVPGRPGILIHGGTFAGDVSKGKRSDSDGCLLPAQKFTVIRNQRAGLGSRAALAALHRFTGRQPFRLRVTAPISSPVADLPTTVRS